MPIESFEFIKLTIGVLIIIIPGYLWSFLFSKRLTNLERFVFGFISGIGVITCGTFLINTFFNVPITQNLVIFLFAIYSILAFVFLGLSWLSNREIQLPKINIKCIIINKKFVLLAAILIFSFLMVFLPHISNNYFFPFHVDEWIHWSYSRSVIESGSTTFLNPYIGEGQIANPEIGFHLATVCVKYLSGCNLLTIFLFMPSIIGVFISLTAFNIGDRSERKFGLESAFLIGFIPTTIRLLGPSFYVAATLGLLLFIFIIWLGQLKDRKGALMITAIIWLMFIVHPPTALAGMIVIFIFSLSLAFEKEYKIAVLTSSVLTISTVIIYYFATRWEYTIEMLLQAISGEKYISILPEVWIDFRHLGLITWALFIVGIYYSFTCGKSLKHTLSFSSIVFIIIIGFYGLFGYGVPIIYERSFLYLFLLVALIAGVGFNELREYIENIARTNVLKKYKRISKNIRFVFPLIICILLIITAFPAHVKIPYYQMIDEKDYDTFIWIRNNIEDYRDENHSYDRAAIDPYKASPFSAITGLYIVSSTMHPLYGLKYHSDMEKFLREECVNTDFLNEFKINVICGTCNNDNLTMIHDGVYIYPGLNET